MFTNEVMYAILLVNDYKEKERYEMKKLFIVLKKFIIIGSFKALFM